MEIHGYIRNSVRDNSYALNVFANYELTVAKDHHFNFMIGANAEEGEYQNHWSQRKGLLDDKLPEFNLATGDQTVGGTHNEWGYCRMVRDASTMIITVSGCWN